MSLRDTATAIFIVFLWSTTLLVQKFAVNHISIYALGFLRLLPAVSLLFIYRTPPSQVWRYILAGFFWNVLNFLFIALGLKLGVGGSVASFLIQTNVFFGVFFCYLFLHEKIQIFEIMGMIIAFFGVYLLTQENSHVLHGSTITGIFSILLSSVCWGIGFTLLKKMNIGSSMRDNVWLSALSVPSLFIIPFIFEGPQSAFSAFSNINSIGIACAFYTGIVSTIFASYLWLKLAQRIPSSQQAPFMLLLPLFTCIFSALFMQEKLNSHQFFAGGFILGGVCITRWASLLKKFRVNIFLIKRKVTSHD